MLMQFIQHDGWISMTFEPNVALATVVDASTIDDMMFMLDMLFANVAF